MIITRRYSLAMGVCLLAGSVVGAPLATATAGTTSPAGASLPSALDSVSELAQTLDTRAVTQAVVPSTSTRNGLKALLAESSSGARATWDQRFGTLRSLRGSGYLTAAKSGAAADIARAWVREHASAFGLTTAQVDALALARDHVLPGTGTHTVSLVQTAGGVPSARGGRLNVAVTSDGRVLSYAGDPTPGEGLTGGWVLGEAGAVLKAAATLAPGVAYAPQADGTQAGYTTFAKGPFGGPSYAKKVTFGTKTGSVAAYRVYFIKSPQEAWEVILDGTTGNVLYRTSVVQHEDDPQGTVYDNYPGAAKGGTPRQQYFGPNAQSPKGWVDATGVAGTGVTTFGNNADTYANWSNYLAPVDEAPRPVSPTGSFSYAFTDAWQQKKGATVPPSYAEDLNPAATNLFFQHNRIHDDYYALGFTETAGNFQVDNGGKGGMGGDAIKGLVQAGAASGGSPTYTGRDNAYMLTLDDGIPPWSGMFLWEPINDAFEGPYRDGSLDMTVIQHEYSHGLSNRYVAGGSALGSQQAGSMGEGWGDWYALNHAFRTGLESSRAVVGAYATGNDLRGIRNYDYNKNPNTFGDIGYDLTGPEVHADGEIWTATLWDLNKALVAKYGARQGLGGRCPPRDRRHAADRPGPVVPRRPRRDPHGRPRPLPRRRHRPHLVGLRQAWSGRLCRLAHRRRHRPDAGVRPPGAGTQRHGGADPRQRQHGPADPERQGHPRPLRGPGHPAGPHRLRRRLLGQGGRGHLPADDPGTRLRHPDHRGLHHRGRPERLQDDLARPEPGLHGGRRHGGLRLQPGRRLAREVRLRRHRRLASGPRSPAPRHTTTARTSA